MLLEQAAQRRIAVTNAAKLKTRTVKELAEMAQKKKVHGWHEMRKEDLVRALLRKARQVATKRPTEATTSSDSGTPKLTSSKTGATLATNGHGKNGANGRKPALQERREYGEWRERLTC